MRKRRGSAVLDRIDGAIIRALQHEGRLSNKELAARVGLAPSSCLSRVRRLREEGVLGAVHTEVRAPAVGVGLQAMVSVRLAVHQREAFDAFRDHLLALPEVVVLYQLSGADDFVAHVAVRDTETLRSLTLDAFATRPEVGHIETALIFEVARKGLPFYELTP